MTSLTCFDPKKWIWSSHVIAENRSFWLKSTGKTRGANEHHTHTGEREKGEKDHSPGGFDLKWQMLMERADATANFHYFLCVDLLTENVPGWKEWAYGFLCGRRNGCSNNVIQKYLTPFFSVSATLLTHYWLYKTDVASIYCKIHPSNCATYSDSPATKYFLFTFVLLLVCGPFILVKVCFGFGFVERYTANIYVSYI